MNQSQAVKLAADFVRNNLTDLCHELVAVRLEGNYKNASTLKTLEAMCSAWTANSREAAENMVANEAIRSVTINSR